MNTRNRKNKNHDKIKLLIFNKFAKQMYKKKIKWIVIGGLNEFPDKIGRDMDIIVKDRKKIKVIQNIFINCLKKFNIKNIIFKNDFYGNLIIAFDKYFNYYELHICHNKIRSGFFSIQPSWNALKKIDNYYIDPACYAFKNYFSAKKNSIELIDYKKIKKPYWLKLYLLYKFKNKNWNFLSFLIVSIFYIASNPITSFINLFQWIYGRILLMKYNHSQLYFLKNNKVKTHVLMYVKKNFTNSYFRGINCIDKSFFLKNIYFRFYTNNNKFMFFKFIFDFFLFFISLSKRFTYEKMSFCYTLDRTNKFKTCNIETTEKNRILAGIIKGIKISPK